MTGQDPVAAFREEAADLLEQIEHALLDLGGRLDDRGLIDEVFRGLHTLKGSGAMFGFDALAAFTHHCESAFDAVRKGLVAATTELVAVILSAKDHMRYLIDGDEEAVRAQGDAILQQLAAAVEAASQDGAAGESKVEAAAVQGGWHLRFFLPAGSMANGTNPLMLLEELKELGDCTIEAITDHIPTLAELDPTQIHLGWDVVLRGDLPFSAIEDVFIFVMDDMSLDAKPLETPVEAEEAAPVAVPVAVETAVVAPTQNRDVSAAKSEETVRVPAERLDELMDRVGELVIAQSRLSQLAQDVFQKIVVIATGTGRVGLVVDQIIGSHQRLAPSDQIRWTGRPISARLGHRIIFRAWFAAPKGPLS